MRLINRLRFTYSIIFLIIGLILGYLIWGGVLSSLSAALQTAEEEVAEEKSKDIIKFSEEVEEVSEKTKELVGFATITSSSDDKNDLIVLGFEDLKQLEDVFYEGWIVEFENNEAVAKISTGKFNINSEGFIVDTWGKVINKDDPASATFLQIGTNDDVELPVNLLDDNKIFRIIITIEPGDEPLNDLTPSEEVVLSGKVVGNKVIALKTP